MHEKPLVIADGHHRYETALAYRNYCRTPAARRARGIRHGDVRPHGNRRTHHPAHAPRGAQSGEFEWTKFAGDARAIFKWEDIEVRAGKWLYGAIPLPPC